MKIKMDNRFKYLLFIKIMDLISALIGSLRLHRVDRADLQTGEMYYIFYGRRDDEGNIVLHSDPLPFLIEARLTRNDFRRSCYVDHVRRIYPHQKNMQENTVPRDGDTPEAMLAIQNPEYSTGEVLEFYIPGEPINRRSIRQNRRRISSKNRRRISSKNQFKKRKNK